jgi:hypothetical protein
MIYVRTEPGGQSYLLMSQILTQFAAINDRTKRTIFKAFCLVTRPVIRLSKVDNSCYNRVRAI